MARCGSCRFGGMHSRAGCSGHHCRSKGLCLRSPARRLPRPLASATVGVFASTGEFRRPGGELAFPWRGGGLRRPHFFLRRKKCGKESRLDLRSKGPLARCGSCRFGGMHSRAGCSGHHCRSKGLCLRSPARRLPRPLAPATVGVFASTGLAGFAPWRRVHYLSPTGIISRLRAQDGAFRAPARVTFFFCKKKVTKENHLDLRSKDPLARCGSCRFGGMHSRMKCGG